MANKDPAVSASASDSTLNQYLSFLSFCLASSPPPFPALCARQRDVLAAF